MSTINIGNITNATFKVGGADCSIYLGSVKVYPQEEPQTLQWVTYNDGDTIEADLNIYGVKGTANVLANSLIDWFTASRTTVEIDFPECYSNTVSANDDVELVFSDLGCSDYYNCSEQETARGTFQLLIYA